MRVETVDRILKYVPDIRIVTRLLSRIRTKRIVSYFIPEEDVKRGEASEAAKTEIVNDCLQKNWIGLSKSCEIADYVLRHSERYKNRDDKNHIRTDMLFCRLAYGFQPDEYLCFGFDQLDPEERKKWISDLDRYIKIFSMNDIKAAQLFNNKAETYRIFSKYYQRAAIRIKDKRDLNRFIAFCRTTPVFVRKDVFGGMGKGIELIDSTDCDLTALFNDMLSKGEQLLEERIIQNDVMAALNASSVNTIRCITMKTRHGIVVPYTFLKVGRNGSFVDNGGAGGILVGIDAETGVFSTHGYDEFMTEYVQHPDSGVVFKGYAIPRWNELKSICCEMAELVPDVRCIGWDMALTDDGWVVVEGNGMTQFIGPQIVYKRGIKEEVEALMADIELIV